MKALPAIVSTGALALIFSATQSCTTAGSPDGLMVEFLQGENVQEICDSSPEFSWIVPAQKPNSMQAAYQLLAASHPGLLKPGKADLWDSGKVASGASINISYGGTPLRPQQTVYWKVKTWTNQGEASAWSTIHQFSMGNPESDFTASRYPLTQTERQPVNVHQYNDSCWFDFGQVAFGYLRLELPCKVDGREITIRFGEKGSEQGIDRNPGGTIRYYEVTRTLHKGLNQIDVHPPKDNRNTGRDAIKIPEEIGVIAPFRYVEIDNIPVNINAPMVKQIAVHYPFDQSASYFNSDNALLNSIWMLCKYSMKATSFCGVYVDGDRERIPYEADAYINQLSHYAVDREFSLARYSHEYLLKHSTWPSEWKQHSVMLAWADWMYTGNIESLERNYETLKKYKTLEGRAREDGLLKTDGPRNRNDIVDWPEGERDGYDRREVNTVINSFYYLNLCQMADMAAVLGKDDEAATYKEKAAAVKKRFNELLLVDGKYIDGEGSTHSALHANMLPLAVGLVPDDAIESVAAFVKSRGMACSVYGAQYLLEGLYRAGEAQAALDLMTSTEKRSWSNMINCGSTITMEAWDNEYKPNQDWNHAWGAAPGNIISRYLLGVRPLEPGFEKALIQPQPGALKQVYGRIPTIRGTIAVGIDQTSTAWVMDLEIPANMTAKVVLPPTIHPGQVLLNGSPVQARMEANALVLDNIGSGKHQIIVK